MSKHTTDPLAALRPFADAFDRAREKYARRYGPNYSIGLQNFDAMPDAWPMEGLRFDMGTFRRAAAAIARAELAPKEGQA